MTTDVLAALWPYLLTATQFALAAIASAHVVLHKRDVRAAIGWIGLAWLVPFGGPALYLLFGINRIRRRATVLRRRRGEATTSTGGSSARTTLEGHLPADCQHLSAIGALVDRLAETELTTGNRIVPLVTGRDAYRAMIGAIDSARTSISLLSYIFDSDRVGRVFVRALSRAATDRGVRVRVLLDGVGARYARPPISTLLAGERTRVAEFLPTRFPFALPYANLRNHRKVLVVDDDVGFIGGMNIRDGHLATRPGEAIDDVHFQLHGPVVRQLADTFAEDWLFATGERSGEARGPAAAAAADRGDIFARGIAAGPDEALERIRWAMLGALSAARRRIRIVTPYFLPDSAMMTALTLAAMRGVGVDILLPSRGNLRLVQWASRAKLSLLLARGCRIWLTPPPFDHSKLMTVDDGWALIGSANWDPRSLRLNFEFNVECYSASLVAALDVVIDARLARAKAYRWIDDQRRPLVARLRDGAAWLLSPYL
jgi:Phosphatidylserine/phosphatidylglycerophosphate/cardiolipin synthases and related enzymes